MDVLKRIVLSLSLLGSATFPIFGAWKCPRCGFHNLGSPDKSSLVCGICETFAIEFFLNRNVLPAICSQKEFSSLCGWLALFAKANDFTFKIEIKRRISHKTLKKALEDIKGTLPQIKTQADMDRVYKWLQCVAQKGGWAVPNKFSMK